MFACVPLLPLNRLVLIECLRQWGENQRVLPALGLYFRKYAIIGFRYFLQALLRHMELFRGLFADQSALLL